MNKDEFNSSLSVLWMIHTSRSSIEDKATPQLCVASLSFFSSFCNYYRVRLVIKSQRRSCLKWLSQALYTNELLWKKLRGVFDLKPESRNISITISPSELCIKYIVIATAKTKTFYFINFSLSLLWALLRRMAQNHFPLPRPMWSQNEAISNWPWGLSPLAKAT